MQAKYRTHALSTEKTFVMIKPDGVMRGLVGEIIKRLEQRGLKLVALKMIHATRDQVDNFYPKDPAWVERLGSKTLGTFKEYGIDPIKEMGTDDPKVVGAKTRETVLDYIIMGPVIPMVFEGIHAVSTVRKLIGATLPVFADPGTIRGDFSSDAPTAANLESRSIFNLVHASESVEDANKEVAHWFKDGEILDYDRAEHVIMFGDRRNL